MEIKTYAPVIIPTLNRYEHFKRCLESLEKCTGADKTDVYVALDYPPSEKYVEGWRMIDAYLAVKEKQNGFNSLIVYRRKENYFLSGKGNIKSTIKDLPSDIDCYIISEDDNEFAPSFLSYMNACLFRFANDDRIVRVCGYNFPMEINKIYKNNFYISKRFCAWGNGGWKHKDVAYEKYKTLDYLKKVICDDSMYKRLKMVYPRGLYLIHSMLKLNKIHGDAVLEIYAWLNDKYFVLPTITKVRNYGNDGTGVHSLRMDVKKNNLYSKQAMDLNKDFCFTNDIFTCEHIFVDDNYRDRLSLRVIYKSFVVKFDLWLLRHFNYIPKSKYI